MKRTLFLFYLFLVASSTYSQNDTIVLANYEPNSGLPNRTYGWNDNWGLTLNVDNPLKDQVNSSEKVISMHLTNQWGHAIVLDNFTEPISLAAFPNVKLKILSDSAVSKKVGINLIDINGYAVYSETTLPSDVNTKWTEITVDFSSKVTSTPVNFISKIEIYIDRGTGDPAPGNLHNKYYVDDIMFTGPKMTLTTSSIFTLLSEGFSSNAWWMGVSYDGCLSSGDKTLNELRSIQWGGSALSAPANHYNGNDSLRMVMIDWNGQGIAELQPNATRPGLSFLTLKDIGIEGMSNLKFKYNLRWKDAPASFSLAPTVEYKVDNGNWTAVSTSSTLPSSTGTWANGIEYNLSSVNGKKIDIRITNNTTARCLIDEIVFTGTTIFADSVVVNGSGDVSEISTDNGTLQMESTVYPLNAAQNVIWSVENLTGLAEIDQNGLLKAIKNGTVNVKARANDVWGTKVGQKIITLSNQIYYVESISIKGKDDKYVIDKSGEALDIIIEALPEAAHNKTLKISLKPVGETVAASYENGKLIPLRDGQVYIVVEATDGSGVKDSALFTITNQVPLEGIAFTKETDTINTVFGKLKLDVNFTPDSASNKAIVFSLASENADNIITIDQQGNVYPKANGTALVRV